MARYCSPEPLLSRLLHAPILQRPDPSPTHPTLPSRIAPRSALPLTRPTLALAGPDPLSLAGRPRSAHVPHGRVWRLEARQPCATVCHGAVRIMEVGWEGAFECEQ